MSKRKKPVYLAHISEAVRNLDDLVDAAMETRRLEDLARRSEESGPSSRAITDMLAERRRQVEVEGWTPEHDDAHRENELARAGASYARHYYQREWLFADRGDAYRADPPPSAWPWEASWWKPKDPRRDLVRAAALLIAEIERLDRISPP